MPHYNKKLTRAHPYQLLPKFATYTQGISTMCYGHRVYPAIYSFGTGTSPMLADSWQQRVRRFLRYSHAGHLAYALKIEIFCAVLFSEDSPQNVARGGTENLSTKILLSASNIRQVHYNVATD